MCIVNKNAYILLAEAVGYKMWAHLNLSRTQDFQTQQPVKKIKASSATITYRVARWFIFKPKIPLWVNFGGSCNWRCWHILWPFGLFYFHLVYSTYGHLVYFGIFFPFWYVVPRKIWQPWSHIHTHTYFRAIKAEHKKVNLPLSAKCNAATAIFAIRKEWKEPPWVCFAVHC
jgi:hypothetical protein